MSNIYDWVTVLNIDNEVHEAVQDSKLYARVNPNETKNLPRFIAELFVKHMVDHVMNKQGIPISNTVRRDELVSRAIVSIQEFDAPVEKTEYDRTREAIDRKNMSDIDRLVSTPPTAPTPPEILPPVPAPLPPVPQPPTVQEHPATQPDPQEPTPAPVTETVQEQNTQPSKWPENPDRETLLRYAVDVLKLEMDEKTVKTFEGYSDEQLKAELQYDPLSV